jgi:NAD(P)-dependent dehydrogenase (short-subunit alcohol dehydrogenase family)
MMTRRSGRIVNISSGAAYGSDPDVYPYAPAYCISKGTLAHMTNLLAIAVQDYGIGVFALGVGGPTAMIETIVASPNVPEQTRELFRAGLADRSGISASAEMLLFLVSGQADFLTGRQISATDSKDDLLRRADEILRDDLYTLRLRV